VQDRLHVKFDVVAEEIGDHKKSGGLKGSVRHHPNRQRKE
jgi:hypothetical protein